MKIMKQFYPSSLTPIFQKLLQHNIIPILVGGIVRDSFLKKHSKDIDVELYNLKDFTLLESILNEFGNINSVGKSFGVCKLHFQTLEIDFSLPRTETKTGNTHKSFKVETYSHLDFQTASRRRDFTINAIGYNIQTNKILDPYNGINDLKNKYLKAVDPKTFVEDPLRVLRAMQFCARFELEIDPKLFTLCQTMIKNNILENLPVERVFCEFRKLLLQAKKPSIGFDFLEKIGGYSHFNELKQTKYYQQKLNALDNIEVKSLDILLTILVIDLEEKEVESFLNKLTFDKKLRKKIFTLWQYKTSFSQPLSKYKLYKLATNVELQKLLILSKAFYKEKKFQELEKQIKLLGIQTEPLKPFLQGKDLIALGLKPSQKFQTILQECYEAQMKGEIKNIEAAKLWVIQHTQNFK